jgi:hypothetical protein
VRSRRGRRIGAIIACAVLTAACGRLQPIPTSTGLPRGPVATPTAPPATSTGGPPLEWAVHGVDLAPLGAFSLEQLTAVGRRFVGFGRPAGDFDDDAPHVVVVSDDGINWRPSAGPPADVVVETYVLTDGSLWLFGHVGVGDLMERGIWTTTDGDAWEPRAGLKGLDFVGGMIDVVRTKRTWLAQAFESVGENAPAFLLASNDGRVWERVPFPVVGGRQVRTLRGPFAANDDIFVTKLVSADERLQEQTAVSAVSPDGRSWTAGPAMDYQFANTHHLASGPSGFVAVGLWNFDGEPWQGAWYSLDGVGWVPAALNGLPAEDDTTMYKALPFGAGYVALGSHDRGPTVQTSVDGTVWSPVALPAAAPGSQANDIAVAADRVVVVGNGGGLGGEMGPPVVWVGSPPEHPTP